MISQQPLQKQQLKISPQQIQLLNFYALNLPELEQRIYNELDENPFLEFKEQDKTQEKQNENDDVQDYQDYDDYVYDDKVSTNNEYKNFVASGRLSEKPITYFSDFRENAKQQLRCIEMSDEKREIAEYLIDTMNEKGLIDRPIEELSDDISFQMQTIIEPEYIKSIISLLQQLEPVGLGSANIRECLLVQLNKLDTSHPHCIQGKILVEKYYEQLINRRFDKICHDMGISSDELHEVLHFIGKLKFYPARESVSSSEPNHSILPDFVITRHDDRIVVNLYSSKSDTMLINHSLYEQMKEANKANRVARQYIQNKIQSAQWFIDAVNQRENTMLQIMKAIVDFQQEYFLDGDIELLKPMILKDISDITGRDISTISRITANRYVETHFGLIFLKDIFSEKIHTKEGSVVSNKAVQLRIKDIILAEDKKNPLTDQQIAAMLSAEGYTIARRTISKYREVLNIPVANVRSFQFDLKV